jgi:two-component system response regulator RegX3
MTTPSRPKKRILIVEDERPILEGLCDLFTFHGYEVESASDGQVGLDYALTRRYDLIILDVMLPNLDGFAICNTLRQKDRTVPVVMLTAKTTEEDIIAGLSLGADDYIAKPFSIRALVLKVEAILRRTVGDDTRERYITISKRLCVDGANLIGHVDSMHSGITIEFTRREFEILRYLLKHTDRPVTRGELLAEIWGYERATEIETRTVDIHIAKLRKKIESDPKTPRVLTTVRGEGYRLCEAAFDVLSVATV